MKLVGVPSKRLFSRREAAKYLGLHANTVAAMTRDGDLTAYWLCSKWMYKLEDLEAVVDRLYARMVPTRKVPKGATRGDL